VFGHSHKFFLQSFGKTLYINPGSAGPARFKLPRTVVVLRLLEKVQYHVCVPKPIYRFPGPRYTTFAVGFC